MSEIQSKTPLTGAQIRAARALIKWSAADLAAASGLGVATINRAEKQDNIVISLTSANQAAIVSALQDAGVILIAENGEGPGVRLRKDK